MISHCLSLFTLKANLVWFVRCDDKAWCIDLGKAPGFCLTMWYKFNLPNDRLMNSKSVRPAAKKTAVKKTAVKRPAAKKWESEI